MRTKHKKGSCFTVIMNSNWRWYPDPVERVTCILFPEEVVGRAETRFQSENQYLYQLQDVRFSGVGLSRFCTGEESPPCSATFLSHPPHLRGKGILILGHDIMMCRNFPYLFQLKRMESSCMQKFCMHFRELTKLLGTYSLVCLLKHGLLNIGLYPSSN